MYNHPLSDDCSFLPPVNVKDSTTMIALFLKLGPLAGVDEHMYMNHAAMNSSELAAMNHGEMGDGSTSHRYTPVNTLFNTASG